MAWRDNLQQASFRGVPFFVDAHEAAVGRRVQLHEYPQRDKPYAQDLGRKTRVFTVEAYVIGADYMAARDALIRAIERPGSGQLEHPYLGEARATCTGCKVRETTAEGGMARLSLEFVESGEASFPGAGASTRGPVLVAADAAASAVQSSFTQRHKLARRPQFLADAAQGIFSQAVGGMQAAVGQVRGAAAAVAKLNADVEAAKRDLVTLIYTPASVAQSLAGNLRQLVRNVAQGPREALGLARVFYNFGSLLPEVSTSTTSRRTQASNRAEMLRLVRVTAVAEGARSTSQLDFESFQDAAAARDEIAAALDDAMLTGPDDATFDALRTLRAAVVRDVAARGADLRRLVQWSPRATVPALVCAQQLYADATREPELLTRNGVRHPMFVPGAVPLEVLSDAA